MHKGTISMLATATAAVDKVCVVIMLTVPFHCHIAFKNPTTTDLACTNKWKLIRVISKRTYVHKLKQEKIIFCIFHTVNLFCFDSIRGCWFMCVHIYFNCSTFLVGFFALLFWLGRHHTPSFDYRHRYYYQLSAMKAPSNSFRMQSTYINQSTKWKCETKENEKEKEKYQQNPIKLACPYALSMMNKALERTLDDEKTTTMNQTKDKMNEV